MGASAPQFDICNKREQIFFYVTICDWFFKEETQPSVSLSNNLLSHLKAKLIKRGERKGSVNPFVPIAPFL